MTAPARMVLASLLVATLYGPAAAQDNDRASINQMNTTRPGQPAATGASQIGSPAAARAITSTEAGDRRVAGSLPSGPGAAVSTQVSRGEASSDAGPQLSRTPGGVGPAPSAEARAAGRITTVTTPRGPDRCDPQGGRPLPSGCDRVIEARAGDFPAPDPQPLSAEQRLLVAQREVRSSSLDAGTAARRLANGDFDDQTAAIAMASSALQSRGPEPDEEDMPAEANPALDAIVASITGLVTGVPPTP